MEQKQIHYKTVLDLGFEHEEHDDENFYNKYGFNWFTMELKLTKTIYLDWDCETRLVTMIRADKEGFIKAQIPIMNDQHLKQTIDFFKGTKHAEQPCATGSVVVSTHDACAPFTTLA